MDIGGKEDGGGTRVVHRRTAFYGRLSVHRFNFQQRRGEDTIVSSSFA